MHLTYKQLRLYINLHIKNQHLFQLCNDDLSSIYTFQTIFEFDFKSINQEFILFRKSLNKQSIQYFIIQLH